MTIAQVNTALFNGKVGVGAGCWAVRIGDLVYFRNTAGMLSQNQPKLLH